jgi:hypothetical protein
MIRNFPSRLQRLETQLTRRRTSARDEQVPTLVETVRERRLRGLSEEERKIEMECHRLQQLTPPADRPRTIAEVIRTERFRLRDLTALAVDNLARSLESLGTAGEGR